MSRRRIGWLTMAAVLVAFLAVGITDDDGPRTPDERAQHLAESLMCPTCRGQSVADSDSSASRGIRNYIDARIGEGASDRQIRDELAASYGDSIVLTPDRSGIEGLVWLLPVVALVAAAAGVVLAFRRWRGQRPVRASDVDRATVDSALAERR
ncbi:MAG: cytochrome c-type biogenesis protein [Acidimicrobiales bacterium]